MGDDAEHEAAPDGGAIPMPLPGVEDDVIDRLYGEAILWEGAAAHAEEWLAFTRAALAEARAERDRALRDRDDGLGAPVSAICARVEELEDTERVQAAHAADARPRADAAAAMLAEAVRRRAALMRLEAEDGPGSGGTAGADG